MKTLRLKSGSTSSGVICWLMAAIRKNDLRAPGITSWETAEAGPLDALDAARLSDGARGRAPLPATESLTVRSSAMNTENETIEHFTAGPPGSYGPFHLELMAKVRSKGDGSPFPGLLKTGSGSRFSVFRKIPHFAFVSNPFFCQFCRIALGALFWPI